jgi:hypothetical protein
MRVRRPLAAVLAFGLLAAACGGDDDAAGSTTATASPAATTQPPSEAQVIDSADGKLRLKVPAGSPEVSIAEITPEEAGVADVHLALGSYELSPSGAVFETPVVATFQTGMTHEAGDPLPLVAIAVENPAGDYEVLSTRVDLTGGTMTLTAEIPHFSRLVIVGTPDALEIWPDEIIAPVGARWWAEWGIYDSRLAPLTNASARIQYRRESYTGEEGFLSIEPLIEGIDIDPFAVASGVVDIWEDSSVDTYAYLPEADYEDPSAFLEPDVEVFWGDALFGCDVEGSGTYGFDVAVFLPPGSVAFATRLADGRRAVVVPGGGATIGYADERDAFCIDTRYGSTVRILSELFEVPAAWVQEMFDSVFEDGMNDGIWSISSVTPGIYRANVDLWDAGAYRLRLKRKVLDLNINYSLFECGETRALEDQGGIEVTTVCADDPRPIPAGEDVVVVPALYSDALPIDGDGSEYVYSVVFESNGDPADDWQYQGDFDWDFFRDTDRWYQLSIHGDGSKDVYVSEPLGAALPSGVRALLFEDSILWLIPSGEFDGDTLSARVTSFVHDGSYDPDTGQGDVSGADPTEPLMEVIPVGG